MGSSNPFPGFGERSTDETATLYDRDFYAWTQEQARLLRERVTTDIDWANAAEEIESLGRSSKTEIRNRLRVLLMHLLKWHFQPEYRSHSWQTTIGDQRTFIAGILDDSPSLRGFPAEVLSSSYDRARRKAAEETRLPIHSLPESSPYTVEQALDDTFMPGRPWSPDTLGD